MTKYIPVVTVIPPGTVVIRHNLVESRKTNKVPIIAGSLGGLVALILLGIIVFFILRRRRRRQQEGLEMPPALASPEPTRPSLSYPGLPPPVSQVRVQGQSPSNIVPDPHPYMTHARAYTQGQQQSTSMGTGSSSSGAGGVGGPPRNIMTVTHRSQSPNSRGAGGREGEAALSSMFSSATDLRNVSSVSVGQDAAYHTPSSSGGGASGYYPNRVGRGNGGSGSEAGLAPTGTGAMRRLGEEEEEEEVEDWSPFDDRNRAPTPTLHPNPNMNPNTNVRGVFVHEDGGSVRAETPGLPPYVGSGGGERF
ncbi:hypothetical protein NMY22_g15466 [Coprinellus aureogranulatus]|nr:hypothetical protein NMY22_g15466 [Coprinellus aureogranulatus]